jgi:hypothetical protein
MYQDGNLFTPISFEKWCWIVSTITLACSQSFLYNWIVVVLLFLTFISSTTKHYQSNLLKNVLTWVDSLLFQFLTIVKRSQILFHNTMSPLTFIKLWHMQELILLSYNFNKIVFFTKKINSWILTLFHHTFCISILTSSTTCILKIRKNGWLNRNKT